MRLFSVRLFRPSALFHFYPIFSETNPNFFHFRRFLRIQSPNPKPDSSDFHIGRFPYIQNPNPNPNPNPPKPKPRFHIPRFPHIHTPPNPNPNQNRKTPNLSKNPKPSSSSIDHGFEFDDFLTEEQKEVLRAVSEGRSVFITGSAGTGKSFLLRQAIDILNALHYNAHVFVTASTGVAACALNGVTLHSFAGVGLAADHNANSLLLKVSRNRPALKRWRHCKALVIDEVSMIDGELFDRLELIARSLQHRRKVWGGIQLVVSGDFFQLPPVNSRNPDKEFAFEADCWSRSFDLQVELTHVFRQSDAQLVELLQAIRKGRSDLDYYRLLSRCFVEPQLGELGGRDSPVTRLYPRNEDVRRVNEERLRSLGGEIITYIAQDEGEESGKRQLKVGIAPEKLELALGAHVMLLKNLDPENGLVNGATGTVTGFVKSRKSAVSSICDRRVLPRVRFDSELEMVVEPDSWVVMEADKVLATRRQVPLTLAWAISIHKCQGMTLDRLHTNLSRAFGCGMVYVALSRVRSLDGLYLSGFSSRKIKAHPKVLEYSQKAFSG